MGCEQDCPPPSSAVRATVRRRSAEEVSGRATAPAQILSMTVKAARQARRHGKQGSISTRVPHPLPAAVPAAVERRSAEEVSGRALSPARHPLNERRAGSSSRQRRRTTWSAALRREDTISRTTCRALRHGIPSPKELHELVQPATIARRQRRASKRHGSTPPVLGRGRVSRVVRGYPLPRLTVFTLHTGRVGGSDVK